MLMTEHNLWFYQMLMAGLREAIAATRFETHAAAFLARYRGSPNGQALPELGNG